MSQGTHLTKTMNLEQELNHGVTDCLKSAELLYHLGSFGALVKCAPNLGRKRESDTTSHTFTLKITVKKGKKMVVKKRNSKCLVATEVYH